MTGRRLFGVETEYAVTAMDEAGAVLQYGTFSGRLLAAAARLPHLMGSWQPGLFLGNGSRLYVDAGDHPELAGPECLDPWDVVRYARAGDAVMVGLVEAVCRQTPGVARASVFAGNVDYSGSGTTWGAHESYGHRADPTVLRRRLLSHLVSRVIYCGAGGFNPLSRGLEFTLSPRAHHLNHPVSDQSTRDRGIIHTRDEPLGGHGYRRQHLICGESLRSDLGSWLKVATTALVVALVENGVACGDDVELRAPVETLRLFVGDPSCSRRARTIPHGPMTAVDIQRRYLGHARAHANAAFMPPWTATVCDRWDDILTRLADGPDRVARSLDWAIKLPMYRDRAGRHGFDWGQLPTWTLVVDQLEQARRSVKTPLAPLSAAMIRADEGPVGAQAAALAPLLDEQGLKWEQLDRFLALRAELLEADTRWGQLGPEGVFELLDRAGVLDHRVAGVDRVDHAVEHPPAAGRAAVRGRVIRREWLRKDQCSCGWDHVMDHAAARTLDLSDPFTEVERWSDQRPGEAKAAHDAAATVPPAGERSLWEQIERALSRGRRGAGRRDAST